MKTFNTEEYKLITAYLDKTLSTSETERIEQLIAQDADWKAEVAEIKELLAMNKHLHRMQMVEQVAKIDEEDITEETKVLEELVGPLSRFEKVEVPQEKQLLTRPLWQPILAAASVIVVLGLGFVIYKRTNPDTPEIVINDSTSKDTTHLIKPVPQAPQFDLASQLPSLINEPLELNNVPKNLATQASGIEGEASRDKALKTLEKMAIKASPSDDIQVGSSPDATDDKSVKYPPLSTKDEAYRKLLLGIGYLKSDKAKSAVVVLEQIKDSSIEQDVSWYKALAYLKLKQNEKAKIALQAINDPRYKTDAESLLEAIQP
jgi:hypothetical protein